MSTGPAQSLATFAPAFIAPYVENVWLGAPDRAADVNDVCIPLSSLGAHKDALLDAMVRHYGGDSKLHARALLSQWSKYYFGLAAPAGILAARLLRRPLEMSPEKTQLVLREGMPVALHFAADALKPRTLSDFDNYASLLAHLDAVIGMLAGMTRIAPRVLWSNAGNLLDYLLGQCALLPGEEDDHGDAAWLFGASVRADNEPNPLHAPIRLVEPRSVLLPSPFRVRRVCCVRYEIPGEKQLCSSCPLLLTMRDESLALQDAIT